IIGQPRLSRSGARKRATMNAPFERCHCALQVLSAGGQGSREDWIFRPGRIGDSSQSFFVRDVGVKDVNDAFDVRDQSACLQGLERWRGILRVERLSHIGNPLNQGGTSELVSRKAQ